MHTFVRRGLSAGLLAISTAAVLAGAPAQAGTFSTFDSALRNTTVTASSTTTTKSATSKLGGTIARLPSGNVVTQLTASDCRLGGGTVVVPGDSRCGSLGAAYCRYPDTLAACINQ